MLKCIAAAVAFFFVAAPAAASPDDKTAQNALLGGLIGVGVGSLGLGATSLLAGYAIALHDCPSRACDDSSGTGLILGAPFVAVAGGLLGAAIGTTTGFLLSRIDPEARQTCIALLPASQFWCE